MHSILINDEVKINSQGLIITKKQKIRWWPLRRFWITFNCLKTEKSDYAIFESVMNKEEPIKEGSKILLKSN